MPRTGRGAGLGPNGEFDFTPWKLATNPKPFKLNPISKNDFIAAASTIYHEARHCEQWWHMARYAAMVEKSFLNLAKQLGISTIVAGLAWKKKMKQNDQMRALAKTWYDSVYASGSNKREVVLVKSGLKQTGNNHLMYGFRNGAYTAYAGNLPEEKDAFAVQKLVVDYMKLNL